ncbi:MAG: alpha/beta hydrolase [candidate division Zixibacteria bacterium]|nr:alpha/beta hydrolase [candidate division Zixibacteria bacterium]
MSRDKPYLKGIIYLLMVLLIGTVLVHPQVITRDDINLYEDIVYKTVDGHELKLDIAVPKYLESPAPAIVDFPGGAWQICNKSIDDARYYAEYGFVGVSVEYRTSDIALFPAAVHDCKAAIRWLRAHADEYNINPDKIGVTGISAGAHLAVLLGTSGNDAYLEGQGEYLEQSSLVQAVVDHFGPTDFLAMKDTTGLGLKDFSELPPDETPAALFLGGPVQEKKELARLANPITYIDPNDPPILIGHGEKDGMVIIKQSEILFEALKKAGVPTEFIRIKNAKHQYRPYKWDVNVSPSLAEISELTIQWFEKWLGTPKLNMNNVQKAHREQVGITTSKNYSFYYRLTIDLPGKTKDSYCVGNFIVLCEGKVLAQGEISLSDLSSEENRTYRKDFTLSGIDLDNKEIMWNFRGEIYDSKLSEKYEPMYMQGEKYNDSIRGIGFNININEDKSFKIDKVIYRE